MTVVVELQQPVRIELVDEEIITLGGCDLGFILPGKPPQVLQVEGGSEMAVHSIRTDDVLVGVDGRDTRSMPKEELEELLRGASRLTFERPFGDVVGEWAGTAEEGIARTATGAGAAAVADSSAELASCLERSEATACAEAPADAEGLLPVALGAAAAVPTAATATAVAEGASMEVDMEAPVAATVAPAAAPSGGGRPQELQTGMLVRLVGFQSSAMNGAKGRLGKYSEKQGWEVVLESTSAAKAVRSQNLEALPNQPPEVLAALAGAAKRRGVVPVPTLPHFDGPGPAGGPEWQEDVVPADEDKESWVELMRDAYARQLQAYAEHPEPPPFHRANHFSAVPLPGQPLAEGKFPAQALNFQLQMLLRARSGDFRAQMAPPYAQHYAHGYSGHQSSSNHWVPGSRLGKGFGGGCAGAPYLPPGGAPAAWRER